MRMRMKKIIAGVLAISMVASVITITTKASQRIASQNEAGQSEASQSAAGQSKAGRRDISTEPVAVYTFEDSLNNVADGASDSASAIITGLAGYSGSVQYTDGGHTGRAVRLGNYGLKLNRQNIGSEYSVSVWLKPDGTFRNNQAVLFLGYHNPEKWLGIAGNSGQSVKLWNNDTNDNAYNWNNMANTTISAGVWHNVVITQSGSEACLYLDGKLVTKGSAPEALTGANQDIYIGVNYWDAVFNGLVDDVSVYNRALTADEAYSVYDSRTPAEILSEEGFSVQSALTMFDGEIRKISVDMHNVVKKAEPKITYVSDNTGIATVDASGYVKGVAKGEAAITTTVSIGDVSVSRKTDVTVNESDIPVMKDYAVYYDMGDHTDTTITDVSGHGNNAAVKGNAITFGKDGDDDIVSINQSGSYIEFPQSIMDSLTEAEKFSVEITYARSTKCGAVTWLWCFGSNPKSTGTNYLFYCPSFNNGAIRAGIKDDSNEILFDTTMTNENEKYYTATLVFDEGKLELYVDGIKVREGLSTGYSIMNDVVKNGCINNVLGYIGKSCWTGDSGFVGNIKSFKIYNKALSIEDIQEANRDYYQAELDKKLESLTLESILGRNKDTDNIKYNMILPKTVAECDIVWESSNEDLIKTTGKVTLPQDSDEEVTLTAVITSGILTARKSFTVTVKKDDTPKYTALYMNPWDELEKAAPDTRMAVKAGDTVKLYTVPESVADAVDVSYHSSNSAKATYDDGVLHAIKEGKVTVTALVTAKYNNYVMEYSTALDITDGTVAEPTKEPPVPTDKPDDPIPTDKPDDPTPTEKPDVPSPTKQPDASPTGTPDTGIAPNQTPSPSEDKLTAPAAPKSVQVKAKGVKTKVTAKLTFKQSAGATEYVIYTKSKTVKKFTPAYKIKGKKLYKYNTKTKKYKKAGKATYKKNIVTVSLKGINLKKEKKVQIKIYAVKTKTGYKDAVSKASKTVTLK